MHSARRNPCESCRFKDSSGAFQPHRRGCDPPRTRPSLDGRRRYHFARCGETKVDPKGTSQEAYIDVGLRLSTMQSYLAAIVESSDDAIISKDLNGTIQSFNAAAERMFGYASAEVVGKSITILIPRDRLSEETEILRRLHRGERIDHFETVRMAKDGRLLDISLTVSPVRDAEGKIVGASKIARDISELKRAARAVAAQQEWVLVTLSIIGDSYISSDQSDLVIFLDSTAQPKTALYN